MRHAVVLAAASLLSIGNASAASAAPTSHSFSGTLTSVVDRAGLFGAANASYGSATVGGTISYDSAAFTGCASAAGCAFALSATNSLSETLTFNGRTATVLVTSGIVQFRTVGGAAEFFGTPLSMGSALSFGTAALTFSAIPDFEASTFYASMPILAAPVEVGTAAAVPEPSALSLVALGLAAARRLRRAVR